MFFVVVVDRIGDWFLFVNVNIRSELAIVRTSIHENL